MQYYSDTCPRTSAANTLDLTEDELITPEPLHPHFDGFPFTVWIDPLSSRQELVDVLSGSGTPGDPYIIDRAQGTTLASPHDAGASIYHAVSSADFKKSREHEEAADPHEDREYTRGLLTWVNVESFGAVGDGVTDDTDAFRDAIDNANGRNILIGRGTSGLGTFLISDDIDLPVVLNTGFKVQGLGQGLTTINYSGTGYCFTIGDNGVNDARWVYVEDMTIIGSASALGAVRFFHTRFCGVEDLDIRTFAHASARGILIDGSNHNYFNTINRCKFQNIQAGIELNAATGVGANSNWVFQCWFGGHATAGVLVDGGDTNVIERCEFNGSTPTAISVLNAAINTKVLYNQFDGPTTHVNIATAAVTGTWIEGNTGGAGFVVNDNGTNTIIIDPQTSVFTGRDGIVIGGTNAKVGAHTLTVKGVASQTGVLFRCLNSAGTSMFSIDAVGNADVRSSLTVHARSVFKNDVGGSSNIVTVDAVGTPAANLLRLLMASGQTADALQVRNFSTVDLFAIGANGAFKVKNGANQRIGQATLVAGTVTVANTSVTANTLIYLTVETGGGTRGFLSYTKIAGTSFTINSTSATDTSVVNWWLIESIP